jgi:hypothetical protein
VSHPARYSAAILDVLRKELADAPHVHDPFAGTGERLGALCDELGVTFSGCELEAPFIVDPRVCLGDSRAPDTYPDGWCGEDAHYCAGCLARRPYWIATSPVYANGMADNFKPKDASKRYTYRAGLIALTGNPNAKLAEGNMGRSSYRGGRKARERYWTIAREVIAQWCHAERVIVNVSDFPMAGKMVEHVAEWCDALAAAGWQVARYIEVPTPRMRNGANGKLRAEHEVVLVCERLP